ncbi:hypothetical protein ACP70R_013649 [Stipagrostis hirtigluma subsp. patula]
MAKAVYSVRSLVHKHTPSKLVHNTSNPPVAAAARSTRL